MWPWWVFGHKHPEYLMKIRCLYRLLVSQSCIKADTAMYDRSSPMCMLCDKNVPEYPYHMLFDCDAFDTIRVCQWNNVLNTIPDAMRQDIEHMKSNKKTEFIMSGMHCNYVDEWNEIYQVMIDFCYAIYRERRDLP